MNKWLLSTVSTALFALLAANPALAATAENVILLASFQSTAGETKDTFILRIAPTINEWTAQNHAEACGAIAAKDGAYSVVITTQGSQVQCDSAVVMKGWEATGETVHSHSMPEGSDGVLHVTLATSVVSGGHLHEGERIKPVYGFSGGDYEVGSGYVILGDSVVYQSGPGTDINIR